MSSIYDKSSLILIPSGTKTSKVYSQKPVNGDGDFTFSRSTAATRVNADGNIEKETSNLLLQSNSFNTTWTNTNTTDTGGQSGYDGNNNAWLLTATQPSDVRIQQSISFSGVHTISIYAKAGTANFVELVAIGGSNPRAWFNLSSGSVGTSYSTIDTNIESVGSGWYRCSITLNESISSLRIYLSDGDNSTAVTNGAYIYIQDAQLNQGLIAQEVITTTTAAVEGGITDNVPRLDYTDSSCPALLLEPQRTNSYTNSEYFDDWLSNRLDRTANNIISPEGVQNAYKMAQQSGFTTAPNINKGGVAAGTYTISIFAKKGSWNYLAISFQGVSYFNLETGSKGTINSNHTATIEDYGNGWYRCAITRTTTTTQTPAFYFAESDNTLTTPDTQGYMYTFGAQLEASASYATSYIPTYGTSVTFAADDCDAVSATSLIGQSEGTLFLDFVANDDDALQIIYQVRTTGSTNVGQIDFRIQSGNLRTLGADAGTTQFNISAGAAVAGTRYKCAVRYANNNVAFYVNGVLKGSDTNASLSSSSLDQITFNENGNNFYPSVNVNQALVIPTALPNTELAALTTI